MSVGIGGGSSGDHLDEMAELYALGALEPSEGAAVEAHVAGCASCARALAVARASIAMLEDATTTRLEPPERLASRIARSARTAVSLALPSRRCPERRSRRAFSPRLQPFPRGRDRGRRDRRAVARCGPGVARKYGARIDRNLALLARRPLRSRARWPSRQGPLCARRRVGLRHPHERDVRMPCPGPVRARRHRPRAPGCAGHDGNAVRAPERPSDLARARRRRRAGRRVGAPRISESARTSVASAAVTGAIPEALGFAEPAF